VSKGCIFTVLLLLGSGCATMKIAALKERSAESCEYHAQEKQVAIGIHPVTDKREMKEIFKVDLSDKGLLPILLVAENRSASSFIISKDQVHVADEASGTSRTSQLTNVTSQAAGTAIGLAGGAAAAAGVIPGPGLLLAFGGLKLASDATVIQHNLADKQLYSRTIGPGQNVQGFVYVQYPEGTRLSGPYHIAVEVKESSTGDVTLFDFTVDLIPAKP